MANAVKFEVIAEGVETQEHRDFLIAHGCSDAQGFLYSPAVSSQEIQAMVSCEERKGATYDRAIVEMC
jgi:EAL domain-containing protein (putative c-di-GMP-specific phosphodiesterase class I)